MAKKPRKNTPQEDLVADFCKHSISRRSTFHPALWRSGTEPADMVIVIGRSLFMFNMTEGGSYFHQLYAHNIDQARDRIVEWKAGRQIRGKNEWREFAIDWSDIDDIAIVSVVEGRHAACMRHSLLNLNLDPKVRLCATLTNKVLHEFAKTGGSARDLIELCTAPKFDIPLNQHGGLTWLRNKSTALAQIYRKPLENIKIENDQYLFGGVKVDSFDNMRLTLTHLKTETFGFVDVLADLSLEDIYAISGFVTFNVAEMEPLPDGQIRAKVFGGTIKIFVIVSSNMEELNKRHSELHAQSVQWGCCMALTVSLSPIGPIPMLTVYKGYTPTATTQALSKLS